MRKGMDRSTTGDVSRADMLREQVQPLYDQARLKAREDAIAYMTGVQRQRGTNQQQSIDFQNATYGNAGTAYGSPLEYMLRVGNAPSAANSDYLRLGSGILDRNLVSGTDYSAPIAPTGARFDFSSISPGFVNLMPSSAAGTAFSNVSGYANWIDPSMKTSAGTLFGASNNFLSPTMNSNLLASLMGAGQTAAQGKGAATADLFKNGGAFLSGLGLF